MYLNRCEGQQVSFNGDVTTGVLLHQNNLLLVRIQYQVEAMQYICNMY